MTAMSVGDGGSPPLVKYLLAHLMELPLQHGVGNWKAILDDPALTFAEDRTPVDLKDRYASSIDTHYIVFPPLSRSFRLCYRFRTYFPQSYRQLYPNAKTHLSTGRARAELPDTYDLFEKNRSKKRRPFTPEEDAALREGFEKVRRSQSTFTRYLLDPQHGTVWALIAKNPVLASRRSTDLRDRFRNAFPDLYEQAGYKPRPSRMQKKKSRSYEPPSHPQEQSLERVQGALDDPEEEEADMACDGPYGQATYTHDSKAVLEQNRPASAPGVGRHSMSPHNDPSPPAASLIAVTKISTPANADGGDGAQAQTPGTTHAPLPYQPEARMHPSSASPPSAQLSPSAPRSHSTAEYFSNGETRGGYDPPMFDLKSSASWYPHRWLSATGAGGATTRVDDLADYQQQSTSGGANSHIWQTWLPSGGGWANQRGVIDRLDLPASSFVPEFASEAAVGDTGSSISGAADVALPPSSHHPYAGDLFHGRGTYGGYGVPLSLMFEPGQMSFGRAAVAMDLGGAGASSANVGGGGVRPQDLTLDTMDEYPNVSMEELSASASEPVTVQASSPPLFSQQLQGQQIQPQSSASSSQHRLDALTEGLSLSSPPPQSPGPVSPPPPINTTRLFSSTDIYPVSSSGRHQYGYGGSTNSHSRSLSQPPSEHRLPMDVRSATAFNSPAQSLYELTNGNAGFSPPPFSAQNLYGASSPVPQVPQSPIHLFGDQQQQQNNQLGRQFLNDFYNPPTGMFSLSTAAAALDLHGFNGPTHSAHNLHTHNYGYDRQFLSYQGTPTMGTTSLGLGLGLGPTPGAAGNNHTSSFGGMDQYVDFGTANALDLATASNNSTTMSNSYSANGLGGSMLGLVEEPTSMTVDPNSGRGYALQMSPSQASRQQSQSQPQSQQQQQQQQAGQGVFSGRVMSTSGVGVGIQPAFTQFGPTSTSNQQHSSSGELFAGAASSNGCSNGSGPSPARPNIGRKRASWGGQR